MQRIQVWGPCGSGKSTLAARLGAALGLAVRLRSPREVNAFVAALAVVEPSPAAATLPR